MNRIANPIQAPPAEARAAGPVDFLIRSEKLREQYVKAVRRGDAAEAQRIAELMQTPDPRAQEELARLRSLTMTTERPAGRRPNAGEEQRLQNSLAQVEAAIGRLTERKSRLLKRVADGPDDAVFSRLNEVDAKLQELHYRQNAINLELKSFEDWRRSEEREQRLKAEIESRERRERERKRAIDELDELAQEVARHWEAVVRGLSVIKAKAEELGEPEGPWLGEILEKCGAVESLVTLCGIPNPWVFPNPSLERGE